MRKIVAKHSPMKIEGPRMPAGVFIGFNTMKAAEDFATEAALACLGDKFSVEILVKCLAEHGREFSLWKKKAKRERRKDGHL